MKNKHISIGVDVGGSHISCAAFDLSNGMRLRGTIQSIPLNNQGTKEEILDSFLGLIQTCINQIGEENLAGIGIAMPGPFDYVHGIGLFSGDNAKFQNLNGVNLVVDLQKRLNLPDAPIRFINDATAFAIGEYFSGKLKNVKHSLAITLGTGLGSAFLLEGIPVMSEDTVPENGYIWNLPFENGIADDYFSTRGLLKRFYEKTGIKVIGVKEIAELANENKDAIELFKDFGEKLIAFLSPWLAKFEAEAIVFGGNISKASYLLKGAMLNQAREEKLQLEIHFSELEETASFIGSAYLLQEDFWQLIQGQLKYM